MIGESIYPCCTWNHLVDTEATSGHHPCSTLMHWGLLCPQGAVSRINLPNSLRLFCAYNTPDWVLDVVASPDDRPKPQSDWSSESNLGTYQCRVWRLRVSRQAHTNAPMFVHVPTYTLASLHNHFFVCWLSTATHLLPDLVTQLHAYSLTSLSVYLLICCMHTFLRSCLLHAYPLRY